MESRTRGAGKGQSDHLKTSEALLDHQTELEEHNRQEALMRLKRGEGSGAGPSGPVETPVAYKSADSYPQDGGRKTNMSIVDGKQEAVLVPVFGRLVPFHISNVKNVTKNEEGGWTFLRLNFVAPGAAFSKNDMPSEAKPTDHYIREITLKSKSSINLNNTFRMIKELRKRVTAREKQVALEADLVTQAALQLIRTGKIHRLRDVHVRPTVGGKKAPGVLEVHANGLRFNAARGEKLDLIFSNIKLAFFQARLSVR